MTEDDDIRGEWMPNGFVVREKGNGDAYVFAEEPSDLIAWK